MFSSHLTAASNSSTTERKLTFGIVIVHPTRNRREDYKPMAEILRKAVQTVQPGQVLHVRAED